MFAVGNVSVDALGRLLGHLGAGPGGDCHVVVTDAREELVVYVNGGWGGVCGETVLPDLVYCLCLQ